MPDFNLKHSNPFEALGTLMSALASETRRTNTSREFFELAMRDREIDPVDDMGDVLALFSECERILQLPFLSEQEPAVEAHRSHLKVQRDSFLGMAYSNDSMQACNNFKATWNRGTWAIMSQSVKSFRNEYQNYQLIEFVKRYLTLLHQLLNQSEKNETVADALKILTKLLNSLDEDLWKSSWEEYAREFSVLDGLLRTESEQNPDSPLSTFYRSTRETVWKVIYHTNRVTDAILFVPKAYAVLNIGIALLSWDTLPPESIRIVEEFMGLVPQLALTDGGSNTVPVERDALSESTVASQVE